MITRDEIREMRLEIRALRRRVRLLGVLAGVIPAAGLALAMGAPGGDTVRAERFELIDAGGVVRASLGFEESEPTLVIYGDDGGRRLALLHDEEQTGIFIYDDEETVRVGAAQFFHGGGGFALHGPDGKGGAVLYLKGAGSLTVFDGEGDVTARFPEPEGGTP